jgi:hypothetical protein
MNKFKDSGADEFFLKYNDENNNNVCINEFFKDLIHFMGIDF